MEPQTQIIRWHRPTEQDLAKCKTHTQAIKEFGKYSCLSPRSTPIECELWGRCLQEWMPLYYQRRCPYASSAVIRGPEIEFPCHICVVEVEELKQNGGLST